MKIAFFTSSLGLRGTGTSLYQYARYNEELLGNESLICSIECLDQSAKPKFDNRFGDRVKLVNSFETCMNDLIIREKVDWVYIIKMGTIDSLYTEICPTFIHSVFRFNEPHGSVYAYVSDWLAKDQGYNPETHSLPHICEPLPFTDENLRSQLSIPSKAKVFGYLGGETEFNIPFVHEEIKKIIQKRDDIYFIFMNINKFCEDHKQIKHLPGTFDMLLKSKFVNTCDAMIHARYGGETFGLSVAEFSTSNKPVVTYKLSGEKNHIEMLGDKGIYYSDHIELYDILNNLDSYIKYDDYYKCYDSCSPENIMNKFNNFINGKI